MDIPILDTHQHLIYPEKWPYSWAQRNPKLAGKAFRYDDYLSAIQGTGIAGSVFMETSPDDPHWHEETQFVLELSRRPGSLIRGLISNCRPEVKEGFRVFVESIASERLVGFRRFLHAVPDETSMPAHFIQNLRMLADYDLNFDLCVHARQIPLAIRLVKQCPNVQFILDHCGGPDIAGEMLEPWRTDLHELAKLPNIACKISGVLTSCRPGHVNTETVRPYVEHCLGTFGWNRVVWGSDWPVVTKTSSIRDWVAVTRELVADEDPVHQKKLFYDNAVALYRLGA
jgi:predicted TIM-barrel fold metal-dependent hydrolase